MQRLLQSVLNRLVRHFMKRRVVLFYILRGKIMCEILTQSYVLRKNVTVVVLKSNMR